MELTAYTKDKSTLKKKAKSRRSIGQKSNKSTGNSADDVLINESARMLKYISKENQEKIVNYETALRFGVRKIGSANDSANILGGELIPETSQHAREIGARKLFKLVNKDLFYTKKRFFRDVSYKRNGRLIQYKQAYEVTNKGIKRVKTPRKGKKKKGL